MSTRSGYQLWVQWPQKGHADRLKLVILYFFFQVHT